jgi:hypothetical protein
MSESVARAKVDRLIRQLLGLDDACLLGAFVIMGLATFVWLAHPARKAKKAAAPNQTSSGSKLRN